MVGLKTEVLSLWPSYHIFFTREKVLVKWQESQSIGSLIFDSMVFCGSGECNIFNIYVLHICNIDVI